MWSRCNHSLNDWIQLLRCSNKGWTLGHLYGDDQTRKVGRIGKFLWHNYFMPQIERCRTMFSTFKENFIKLSNLFQCPKVCWNHKHRNPWTLWGFLAPLLIKLDRRTKYQTMVLASTFLFFGYYWMCIVITNILNSRKRIWPTTFPQL